jgi:hypothetical protein
VKRVSAVLIGLAVLIVIAVPAASSGLMAYISFTGCFLGCTEIHPLRGVFYAAVALVLLAAPVLVTLLLTRPTASSREDRRPNRR